MITPPPNIGSWIKIKLKTPDKSGESIWTGCVENVSDIGVTINDGAPASACTIASTVPWEAIEGYDYFDNDEPGNYYVGDSSPPK